MEHRGAGVVSPKTATVLGLRDCTLIADSGPLIALAGVGRLELLPQLNRIICVPPAVSDELRSAETPRPDTSAFAQATWLTTVPAP
jgi:predicted nucleic acid-binding protein